MTVLESFFKNFLEPFSYLIYAVILCVKFRKDKTFEKQALFVYYLCATLLLLVASFLAMYIKNQIDNNWLYNIFYLITICILSYYFHNILNNKTKKNVVTFLLIINLVLFIIYDIVFRQ